jgi:hypothetical protein
MPHSGQRIVALKAGMSSKLSGSASMPLKKSCPFVDSAPSDCPLVPPSYDGAPASRRWTSGEGRPTPSAKGVHRADSTTANQTALFPSSRSADRSVVYTSPPPAALRCPWRALEVARDLGPGWPLGVFWRVESKSPLARSKVPAGWHSPLDSAKVAPKWNARQG